jgi:hypothetical protein
MKCRRIYPLVPAIGLALTLFLGCTKFHGDYTVLSNRLVRTSEFELSKREKREDVIGEDVAHIIVLIPTKAQVTLEEAIENALDAGGGDVLTDAKVWFWSWYIPYIYGQQGWRVEGDVINTRSR